MYLTSLHPFEAKADIIEEGMAVLVREEFMAQDYVGRERLKQGCSVCRGSFQCNLNLCFDYETTLGI